MADEPRPAHGSAVGHTIGLGGNGLLWALGTYGWGVAAAIGGLFGLFAVSSLRRRRRSNKRSGGLGGGTGGSKGLGGALRRLLGGKRSGGRSSSRGRGSSRSGLLGGKGSKSGKGGFLRRMVERRSTSPGRRGGLPGRGGDKTGRMSRLFGRSGGKRTPGGKDRSAVGGGSKGSKAGSRQQSGNATPRGGRLRNLFGGGKSSGGKTSKGPKGTGANGSKGGSKSGKNPKKKRNFSCVLPPRWPSKSKGGKKKRHNQLGGWTQVPIPGKGTKMTQATPKPPARRPARKAPSPRAATTGATAGTGGGHFTAGAEQFAQTLSKPGAPVDTVKGMDRALDDLGNSMTVVGGGLKNFRTVMEDAMPDEGALHDQIGQYAQQLAQIAEGINLMRADQHRRNAADHERIDNNRKNEQGYDYTKNQD